MEKEGEQLTICRFLLIFTFLCVIRLPQLEQIPSRQEIVNNFDITCHVYRVFQWLRLFALGGSTVIRVRVSETGGIICPLIFFFAGNLRKIGARPKQMATAFLSDWAGQIEATSVLRVIQEN